MNWKLIQGGLCAYGDRSLPRLVRDLWWTVTPVTWEQLGRTNPLGDNREPATGINWFEAALLSKEMTARLPSSTEWEWMAAGAERRLFPWGNADWDRNKANLRPLELSKATPVGQFIEGATPEGLLDVAGNVWEWTSSLTPNEGAVIRGGSYNSTIIYAQTRFLNSAPQELVSRGIGLRLVRDYV